MKLVALLVIIAIAAVNAGTITLPVTQDFAVVNPGRTKTSISTADTLSLFNNGISSSIVYFGVDLNPVIDAASITTSSVISTVIESARLVVRNFTIIGSFGSDPITIPFSSLNPGQVFEEKAVTVSSTPTVRGQMGTITFSNSGATTMDVTNFIVEALTMPYQGGLFGFQVGPPGGPIEIPSHRVDPDAVVVEIEYNMWIHGGTDQPSSTAPATSTTTTTTSAAPETTTVPPVPTTSTSAPASTAVPSSARNCWSCGPGWKHWYELGLTEPADPCACVQIPTTTTTAAPVPPTTAQPSGQQGTPTPLPQDSVTTAPERNGAERVYSVGAVILSAAVVVMLL